MQKASLEEMKSYLIFKNSAGGCAMAFCCVFFVCMLAAMIYGLTDLDDNGIMALAGGVGALLFGVLLYASLINPRVQSARQEKAWTESGELEQLLSDFASAKPTTFPDVARIGKIYVFGRGTGRPIRYEELVSGRVVTIKNNGVVLETDLTAKLSNGKSVVVCKVPRMNGVPAAIQQVIAAIRAHHPGFVME